jgi:tetratricopeptide (TPR) repeat protein
MRGGSAVTESGWIAWKLWALGWPDRSLATAREAVALAREIDHPFSLAFALFFETVVHFVRRDLVAQRERAAETVALAEEMSFPYWLGLGRAYRAAARVAAGETEALADLQAGLALGAAPGGNRGGAPGVVALLASAQLAAGRHAEAGATVDAALALSAATGQHFYDAELHRLRGAIILARGDAPTEAEAAFRRSLEIAREQEARSPELRTATSLARLWRDQGKRAEARELLAPVYGWFSEGFDARDLKDAKALLEELA